MSKQKISLPKKIVFPNGAVVHFDETVEPEFVVPEKFLSMPLTKLPAEDVYLEDLNERFVILQNGDIANIRIGLAGGKPAYNFMCFKTTPAFPRAVGCCFVGDEAELRDPDYGGSFQTHMLLDTMFNCAFIFPPPFHRGNRFQVGDEVMAPVLLMKQQERDLHYKNKTMRQQNLRVLHHFQHSLDTRNDVAFAYFHLKPRKVKKVLPKYNMALIEYKETSLWIYMGVLCKQMDLVPFL